LLSCDLGYNPIPNTEIASYERGFGDFTMKADIDSMREIDYTTHHRQLLFFADLYDTNLTSEIPYAPRYLLRKAVSDLKEMGYKVKIECDINFYMFFEKYKKISENFVFQPSTEHSNLYNTLYKQNFDEFLNTLKNSLRLSGINAKSIAGDSAPGQFKLTLSLTDPMEFCDNITLLKLVNLF
jgi:glutamine synthetase